MNCYQCVEKEKCPLRTDPEKRKLFRCEDAEEEVIQEHRGKPAQIHYLPVCSECGKIIQDEVKFIKLRTGMSRDYGIEPEGCPYCGAVFTGITEWRTVVEEAKE